MIRAMLHNIHVKHSTNVEATHSFKIFISYYFLYDIKFNKFLIFFLFLHCL